MIQPIHGLIELESSVLIKKITTLFVLDGQRAELNDKVQAEVHREDPSVCGSVQVCVKTHYYSYTHTELYTSPVQQTELQ